MRHFGIKKTLRYLIRSITKNPVTKPLAASGGIPIRELMMPTHSYEFSAQDAANIARIVASGNLIHDQGSEIYSLEREFAKYIGVDYAVSTNSGTSALHMACFAIGLQPGDEVIIPAYTFIATAQAVLSCGATPVFADIDNTHTVSPKSVESLITKKTKAIMPVHMFGNPANMNALLSLAKKNKLQIIEDAAQAVGAQYKAKSVGSIGDIGCFSFNIHKAIPTGQGGMLVTNNRIYAQRAMLYRNTGIQMTNGKMDVVSFGETFFMTEMEASLALSVLRQLEALNAIRRRNYKYLLSLLEEFKPYILLYNILPHSLPSYSRLSMILDTTSLNCSREEFIQFMNAEGVPLKVFYPTPLYKYSLFKGHGKSSALSLAKMNDSVHLPFVERFEKQHIGMEFSPYLNFQDMRELALAFRKVFSYTINRTKGSL